MLHSLAISASTSRIRAAAVSLTVALLFFASGARALTFVEPAAFAYSGDVSFLADPVMQDFGTGFAMRTDVQIGPGKSFLIGSRRFQIGPLPEQVESLVDENFKLVLSGGSSTPSGATLQGSVKYSIWPDPPETLLPADALGGSGLVSDNGLQVVTSHLLNPLDPVLPVQSILSTGFYHLRAVVELDFTLGGATAFPQSAYAELGGLSSYTGIQASLFGTPVPEPGTAALVGVGLFVLGVRRARSGH